MAMHISKTSAKTIVNEISKLVKQNINLMNEQGIIIASCDKERIGQFHEGAYKIITEKLDEYYISEEKATETARKGLNLPLELDGEIVGVVGITGSYDEVINQGRLLKKMTEILLQEHRRSYHQLMDKRIKNAFMEEWLIRTGYVNEKELEERGNALKIDIHRPRRILIASVDELDTYKETQEGQSKIQKMENCIDDFLKRYEGAIHFRNAMRQVILVDRVSTADLVKTAQETAAYVYEKEKMRLNIGIDGGETNLHQAYLQAHRAWRTASDENDPIICYENLNLEGIGKHPDIDGLIGAIRNNDLYAMASRMENVFEPGIIRQYPVIGNIKNLMEEKGALKAVMSGSGPTVFGIFDNRDKMAAAARSLRKSGLAKTVFATDIYNRDGGVTNDK